MPRTRLSILSAFRRVRTFVTVLLLGTGAACAPTDVTIAGEFGPSALRVTNNGQVELRDVVVLTSDRDSVMIESLKPGAAVSFDRIGAVHETPAVRAMVADRPVALMPVEGFAGFNRKLPVGVYEIALRAEGNPSELALSLRRI